MKPETLRRGLAVLLLALAALGVLSGTARADGDPGSDVLVYQNLFVAADANVSVPQQLALGNLLTAAKAAGFPVRVAIVSQPGDLGAITALWRKPAAYANFLGTELSLAYTGRLLIVMPDGFGFSWTGHSPGAAGPVLARVPIGAGGPGLATAAGSAVRALATAAGVHLVVPAGPAAPGSAPAGAAGAGAGPPVAGAGDAGPGAGQPSTASASGQAMVLAGIALAAALAALAAGWLLLRGWRAWRRADPARRTAGRLVRALTRRVAVHRPAIPVTWLLGGFVGLAVVALVAVSVIHPARGSAPGGTSAAAAAQIDALRDNPSLDPGATLSGAAPGFTLTDQFGQPVSLSAFRGKVVVLAFNDAECTTICPLTTAAMVDAKNMLGKAGSRVQLLGIDANPKAISVEDLLSYSQLHGMAYQWRYLTGSLAQLQRVWKAYSVGVTISQSQTDHEPAIFVIDAQGRLAKLYLTQLAYSAVGQLGQVLASEVASLLPGHPPVSSHLSYAQVSGISPATNTTLPAADGGYVSLGPGQPRQRGPRLYLFFATWDREITTLGGQLDALNAYQSSAGAAGLPGLTAIDEGSVEPTDAALPDFLATQPRPLTYPVAIDGSGQVADGYGVQGAPWFALASADGKVLWSWEVSTSGWPSAAALSQHVRTALAHAAS